MTGSARNLVLKLRKTRPERALVIGAGLAGLFTALKLAPLPVTVITPRPLGEGCASALAQGGIAASVGEGDSPRAHAADTIAAGAGLVEPKVAQLLASEARARIEDLLGYAVPFDRTAEGGLKLSREAAHSARRVAGVRGDTAGKAIMAALIARVAATASITVLENVEAIDLVEADGRIAGVYAVRAGAYDRAFFLPARAVVLASGGVGQLYRVTTNPPEAYGGGLAMAARAGAILADAEFVQFHPTAFDIGRDPAPLASEAIRGEGARLINTQGERFMLDVHPDAELAPRDVVARAVHREIRSGRGAFLDCRHLDLRRAFPAAFEVCKAARIDPKLAPIPIAPAAHYHMGGVLTDALGRTSLLGLWAVGEVASTGAHGANRLASNSLAEAVVFGARAAEDIKGGAHQWYAMEPSRAIQEALDLPRGDEPASLSFGQALRAAMSACAGVERSGVSLKEALRLILSTRAETLLPRGKAMQTAALVIVAAAYARKESRGAHRRLDYPETSAVGARSYLTLADARKIAAEALELEKDRSFNWLDQRKAS